ncbi:MAG TPA: nuclear transport factor 2 family protein [Rhabdaerophilum sp.]|nr:nuclear transport factor 2 family protein [Rhabdaerophilum sp.]
MSAIESGENTRAKRISCIERMLEARRQGDVHAMLDDCADDVSYRIMGRLGDRPLMPPLEGKEQLRSDLAGLLRRWEWTDVSVSHILCDGDIAIAEISGKKTYRLTETVFDHAACILFEFSEEKVRAIREYFDTFTVVRVGGFSM